MNKALLSLTLAATLTGGAIWSMLPASAPSTSTSTPATAAVGQADESEGLPSAWRAVLAGTAALAFLLARRFG